MKTRLPSCSTVNWRRIRHSAGPGGGAPCNTSGMLDGTLTANVPGPTTTAAVIVSPPGYALQAFPFVVGDVPQPLGGACLRRLRICACLRESQVHNWE
jgi:hypothetical protein